VIPIVAKAKTTIIVGSIPFMACPKNIGKIMVASILTMITGKIVVNNINTFFNVRPPLNQIHGLIDKI
jgi:hypothetical protein